MKQVTIAKLKLATAETAAVKNQDKSCWRLISNGILQAKSQQDVHVSNGLELNRKIIDIKLNIPL